MFKNTIFKIEREKLCELEIVIKIAIPPQNRLKGLRWFSRPTPNNGFFTRSRFNLIYFCNLEDYFKYLIPS